jgi:hypothetical protein
VGYKEWFNGSHIVFAERTAILRLICGLITRQIAERVLNGPSELRLSPLTNSLSTVFVGIAIKSAVFRSCVKFSAALGGFFFILGKIQPSFCQEPENVTLACA